MAEGGEDGNDQQDENSNTNSAQKNVSEENPTTTNNDFAPPPQPDSKPEIEELVASTPSSVTSAESDPPIVPPMPRPSIAAALRRGSYFGDANPRRASIAEVLAAAQSDEPFAPSVTTEKTSSLEKSDAASIHSEVEEEQQLSNESCVYIMGFLRGMLERLKLMAMLPGANSKEETSLDLGSIPDGLPELATKSKLLNAANLIKYSLGGPPKISKFALEVAYLTKVMTMTLKEVQDGGTFYKFVDLIEDYRRCVKMLPDSIAHIKRLKESMEVLEDVMEAEAEAHKEARRQWARNIAQRKLELKELRKQNMIQYRYTADDALATGDLARREYAVQLVNLRAENARLKKDLEVEEKVHEASVEFLKKQNMELREEAVALQAGIELDSHNLDHMLEKMRLQRKEKEAILAELEPRYLARMEELEAARLEAIRKQEEFFANQGQIELQTFAALKIQRIWRGYLIRKVWSKQLKKLKRKRLAAKKKKGGNSGKRKAKKKK
ncbi:unnamed protein product [Calypogeia fissa]